MTSKWMTARQAAALKGCSETTLYKYLKDPELKEKWFPESFALGDTRRKTWAVCVKEIEAWVYGSG